MRIESFSEMGERIMKLMENYPEDEELHKIISLYIKQGKILSRSIEVDIQILEKEKRILEESLNVWIIYLNSLMLKNADLY